MWPSPGPWPDSKCSKTVEAICSRDSHWRIPRKKHWQDLHWRNQRRSKIESSEILSTHVSELTSSVMAQGWQEVSAPCGNRTHVLSHTSLLLTLTIKTWVCIDLPKKKGRMNRWIFQPEVIFFVQDWHCQIAQLEYQSQARWISWLQTFYWYVFYYSSSTGHRLELKVFLFLHNFCSILIN